MAIMSNEQGMTELHSSLAETNWNYAYLDNGQDGGLPSHNAMLFVGLQNAKTDDSGIRAV